MFDLGALIFKNRYKLTYHRKWTKTISVPFWANEHGQSPPTNQLGVQETVQEEKSQCSQQNLNKSARMLRRTLLG